MDQSGSLVSYFIYLRIETDSEENYTDPDSTNPDPFTLVCLTLELAGCWANLPTNGLINPNVSYK